MIRCEVSARIESTRPDWSRLSSQTNDLTCKGKFIGAANMAIELSSFETAIAELVDGGANIL